MCTQTALPIATDRLQHQPILVIYFIFFLSYSFYLLIKVLSSFLVESLKHIDGAHSHSPPPPHSSMYEKLINFVFFCYTNHLAESILKEQHKKKRCLHYIFFCDLAAFVCCCWCHILSLIFLCSSSWNIFLVFFFRVLLARQNILSMVENIWHT